MIIGFSGKLSGGKTVTSVKIAYDKWLQGKNVISNIRLNFSPLNERIKIFNNEQFVDMLKSNYQNSYNLKSIFFNSVILLDEISQLIDARSRGNLNEMITGFLMMVGKLDCDVVYTAQIMDSQTDVRLREITNIYGNCYRIDSKGNPLIFDSSRIHKGRIFIKIIFEIDLDISGKIIKTIIYDPEPYYSMYDTREIVLLDRAKYLVGGVKDLRKN